MSNAAVKITQGLHDCSGKCSNRLWCFPFCLHLQAVAFWCMLCRFYHGFKYMYGVQYGPGQIMMSLHCRWPLMAFYIHPTLPPHRMCPCLSLYPVFPLVQLYPVFQLVQLYPVFQRVQLAHSKSDVMNNFAYEVNLPLSFWLWLVSISCKMLPALCLGILPWLFKHCVTAL